ncbi:sodium-dependent transporter [Desulfoluna spongiiphila]|uniref:Transporter n=1 Tax=Desulfoluna spongiiphila TaxID=419481 RepID=A0A1G5IIK8_9BACT|nr:sodium-dependent transporter [Desulfoluna spongiiphila]SCY75823.1 neurotransmitter:Na+ symporter, NSS family [Desulfoluna spongiiphila]VVS90910.1 sodium:neurotransmitter symporter [Desulfoluna spongiiphila]
MSEVENRDQFGSRIGFILASAGSAVGLGNIWRFPFVAGENGGAAFVLIYLLLVFCIGMPVMLAEFVVGRRGQGDPVGSLRRVAGKVFTPLGGMGIFAAIVILSFYGVVGGWTIKYTIDALMGALGTDVPSAGAVFGTFVKDPKAVIFYQALFMLGTYGVVARGIGNGIEKFCTVFMPVLFLLLIVLAVRSVTLPGAAEGLAFYLKPDFSKVNGATILAALGQAFFSLSIGIGVMLTYGSYLKKSEPIVSPAFQICFLDSFVALIAGLVIFPAVFAFGLEPGSGPGLTFVTLPAVFSKMPGGALFAVLFFFLLVIASLTSSMSQLEVICAYFVDDRKWSRGKATLTVTALTFCLGIPSAISLGGGLNIAGKSFLDAMDFMASNVIMPLGGMGFALLAGWVLHTMAKEEFSGSDGEPLAIYPAWRVICCVVAPAAIGWIFVTGLKW